MSDFIIIGDTKEFSDCLICVCGTEDNAKKTLERMRVNPTESDKLLIKGHTNLRIKEVQKEDCWWRGNLD